MGYRINLSNANSVGLLVEGNVFSFLKQTFFDNNYYEGNIDYIEGILSQDNNDFITSHPLELSKNRGVLGRQWPQIKRELRRMYDRKNEIEASRDFENIILENRDVLKYFKRISYLLNRYQVKFLVLPGFEDSELNNLLINRDELIRWLRFRSINSYLIL